MKRTHLHTRTIFLIACMLWLSSAMFGQADNKPAVKDSVTATKADSIIDLQAVIIKSKKVLVEAGKTTFIISSIDAKSSVSALDVLVKTPSLSISADKEVKIKNKINATVLLNGNAIPDLKILDGIPAKNILKIEVLSNPGAAHDVEGIRGIVNIITKKMENGYFVSLLGQLSTEARADHSFDADFSAKSRVVECNINVGVNYYKRPFESTSGWTNLLTGNSFKQSIDASNRGTNYYIVPGTNVYIDSLTKLSYKGSYGPPSDYKSILHSTYYTQSNSGHDSVAFVRNNTDAWTRPSVTNSLALRKRQRGSNNNYSISLRQNAYSTNRNYVGLLSYPTDNPDYAQNNRTRFNELAGQIDYQLFNLLKSEINLGLKYTSRNNASHFSYSNYDTGSGKFIPDASLNNGNTFTGRQQIAAFYFSISKKFGPATSLEIGNRVEHTRDHILFGENNNVNRSYASFLPAVSIAQSFGEAHTVEINFSRRLLRPGINYLNPYMDNGRDPREINQGNPLLKPEMINRYDAGYTFSCKNLYASVSPYLTTTSDVIGVVTSVYSMDTLMKKYDNINSSRDIGVTLNGSMTIKNKARFIYGAGIERNRIAAAGYKQTGTSYYLFAGGSYIMKHDFSVYMSYRLTSAIINFQGMDPKRTNSTLSLDKTFVKKITVSLSISDFLPDNSIWIYRTNDDYLNQYTKNNLHLEVYKVRISYSFGESKNKTNSIIKINSGDLKD